MTRQVLQIIHGGDSSWRDVPREAKFKVGGCYGEEHQPLRAYTSPTVPYEGKLAPLLRVHGDFVFPDTNAHGLGENPQHVYSVRFDGIEVWGDTSEKGEVLYMILWESP